MYLFRWGQLQEVYLVPLFRTCVPVSSLSLDLCAGVCSLDKTATAPNLHGLALYGEDLHQSAQPEILGTSQIFVQSKPPSLQPPGMLSMASFHQHSSTGETEAQP